MTRSFINHGTNISKCLHYWHPVIIIFQHTTSYQLPGTLKLKLIYDRQSVGQSVLVPRTHLGPVTNFFSLLEIFFRQFQVCYFVTPSLTRGRVCNLLYKSRRTHGHILLAHLRLCPSSSPLTTRRDYGGGILTRLHTMSGR
jgi:hypothetical protein